MFYNRHHSQHLRLSRFKKDPMNRLYTFDVIHDIGLSMLAIFTLTYFYYLGWSLPILIVFMLLATLAEALISAPLSNFLLVRHKLVSVLTIGSIVQIVYLVAVLFLTGPSAWGYCLLFFIAILVSTGRKISASAWSVLFVVNQQKGRTGRQLAIFLILADLSGFSAALISGLIAQTWGFGVCLAISSCLTLVSVLPLLSIKEGGRMPDYDLEAKNLNFGKYWQIFKETPKKTLLASLGSINMTQVVLPIWFLYLSIVVFAENSYAGLGLISAAATLVAVIFNKIAGKITDKGNPASLIRKSALAEIVLGLSRPLIINAPLAFGHNILHKQSSIHVIVSSNWYFARSQRKAGEMLAFFQMYVFAKALVKSILLLLVLLLLLIFEGHQLQVLVYSTAGLSVILGLSMLKFEKT